jgi:hypothetical protein
MIDIPSKNERKLLKSNSVNYEALKSQNINININSDEIYNQKEKDKYIYKDKDSKNKNIEKKISHSKFNSKQNDKDKDNDDSLNDSKSNDGDIKKINERKSSRSGNNNLSGKISRDFMKSIRDIDKPINYPNSYFNKTIPIKNESNIIQNTQMSNADFKSN